MNGARAASLKERARVVAARARLRELRDGLGTPPTTAADPDARESVTSSMRIRWPAGALLAFNAVRVIAFTRPRLYDDPAPGVVRPAYPTRAAD
jgi:hypothetical protein